MPGINVGSFAGLVDESRYGQVVDGIVNAVHLSYEEDARRLSLEGHVGRKVLSTEAETKRRVQKCLDMFRVLRGDLKWSIERCVDSMPVYLRTALDGGNWEPDARARSLWTPAG